MPFQDWFKNPFSTKSEQQPVNKTTTEVAYDELVQFISFDKADFSFLKKNIETAQKVEVIDSLLKFICKWFVKGKIRAYDKSGKELETDILLEKLNNPNEYQTRDQFLSQFAYYLKANGQTIIVPYVKSVGFKKDLNRVTLINLNPDETFHPEKAKSIFDIKNDKKDGFRYKEKIRSASYGHQEVITPFRYNEVLNFVDTVSAVKGNKYKGNCNLTSLRDEIKNIYLSKKAKTNKLEHSGITLITPKGKENPLSTGLDKPIVANKNRTHKDLIEDKIHESGLAQKNTIIISEHPLESQNLTEGISQLDFDKECIEDYKRIYRMFCLPEELSGISETKNALGDSGNRKDKATLNFIQQVIEPLAQNLMETCESYFDTGNTYKMTYDHLSVYRLAREMETTEKTNRLELIIRAKEQGFLQEQEAKNLFNELEL